MTALTRDDFTPDDWDHVAMATHDVMHTAWDVQFHRMADSSWTPRATAGDTLALISEAREILDQLESPIKEARRVLACVEGTARLRAHRRGKDGA